MEANPAFQSSSPSAKMTAFVEQIEVADPSAPDIDEEHTNGQWGHQQFVGGNLRLSTIVCKWACVGNTAMARRLIAAALKTCQQARSLCRTQKIMTTSYLSDAYLRETIEKLWNVWQAAGGVEFSDTTFLFTPY